MVLVENHSTVNIDMFWSLHYSVGLFTIRALHPPPKSKNLIFIWNPQHNLSCVFISWLIVYFSSVYDGQQTQNLNFYLKAAAAL